MFTPENIKKLTNVSIVTYKYADTKFELAIYPNTLFDYKKGLITKDKILHTDIIFCDVKNGKIAGQKALKSIFKKMTNDEIVDLILKNGNEKINNESRKNEIEKKENEIFNILTNKLIFQKRKLNNTTLKQQIKKLGYNIDFKKCAKIQANEICKALAQNPDFEIVKIKVMFSNGEVQEIDGAQFMIKKEEWKRDNINYVIKYDEEVEEEDIC